MSKALVGTTFSHLGVDALTPNKEFKITLHFSIAGVETITITCYQKGIPDLTFFMPVLGHGVVDAAHFKLDGVGFIKIIFDNGGWVTINYNESGEQ